ncbi:MAG: Glutaryl-7-ACA acylase, partial [uncultured Sphingomonadaceae bacterium]
MTFRTFAFALAAMASLPGMQRATPDIPRSFTPVRTEFDYDKREVEIPMRDGAKLHTVIFIPRGLKDPAPFLLTRTPYNADGRATRANSPKLGAILPSADDVVAVSGYIRVYQDVRGKYGSEGEYVVNRPWRGPLNPTKVDHSTDTYDTIAWLLKNVPNNNGRVGTIGTSYDGFTTLMSLVDPHPALKAAVPINPMVDGWMGDDWFHMGAFRQTMASWIYDQTATRKNEEKWWSGARDDYDRFLRWGSAGAMGRAMGMEQLGFWNKLTSHPN